MTLLNLNKIIQNIKNRINTHIKSSHYNLERISNIYRERQKLRN